VPSFARETRAVWHNLLRPQTKEIIRKDLEKIANAGFNTVFLDVFAVGLVNYPSELVPMLPNADVGFDVLQEFIDVGHELGLEIHGCMNNCLVGAAGFNFNSKSGSLLLDKVGVEWAAGYKDGTIVEHGEQKGIMLDPSRPEVRQFIVDVYAEIIDNYDIDGINLDFIRYLDDGGSVNTAFGMNEYSANAFKEATGIDILTVTNMQSEEWKKFIDWRAGHITAIVKGTRDMIDEKNAQYGRKVQLSAAVASNVNWAKNTKMQYWPDWVNAGWLDFLSPMSYFQFGSVVYQSTLEMMELCPGIAIVVGLSGTSMLTSEMMTTEQITAARDAGAIGVAMFASYNIDRRAAMYLTDGVFRTKATPLFEVVDRG